MIYLILRFFKVEHCLKSFLYFEIVLITMKKSQKLEIEDKALTKTDKEKIILPKAIWSGSLSMGLVNIPVKAIPITRDKGISFKMLHKSCETPIHYKKYCEKGEEVHANEIVHGYKLGPSKYVIFTDKELEEAKPASSDIINLREFVDFFQADPHYFENTFLLVPNRSERAYSLLRKLMEKTAKAAIGMMTLRSKEHIVLVHYYQNAIVTTLMRYSDEILDVSDTEILGDLPEPSEDEISLGMEIVKKLTRDLDMGEFKDSYRERIEAMVQSKAKGEVIHLEKRPARPEAKGLMDELRATAESLK
jgi:DNA end-binding protein Ku